jgi:hypothetical protein
VVLGGALRPVGCARVWVFGVRRVADVGLWLDVVVSAALRAWTPSGGTLLREADILCRAA